MASAKKSIVNVAVIGAGARSRGVVGNLLNDSGRKVKVLSVYDPDQKIMKLALKHWESPETRICKTYHEAIAVKGVEWVMVFSPNAYHKEHILAGFKAGKHVFSEKPLATEVKDCQEIFEAHKKSRLKFATGFVLRYAPIYRKAKELLESGILGKILSIDANENIAPYHGAYIMRNWRRHTKYAGPHILEKCCHDLDLINWFCDSKVSKVASFGGLDFFTPKHNDIFKKHGDKVFPKVWGDAHALDNPFTADKDLMDNQVAIFQYRNGIKVMFQATMSNQIPERRMSFSCTKGNMIIELYAGTLKYAPLGENTITITFGGDGHGGGDSFLMKELYEGPMTQPKAMPSCSGDEGLESAVLAICIDQAAKANKILDVEPIWKKLDR
ncbi:MAG: hypothetical protein A2X49_03255 [Lentisphaerae bacterium GWF2_52_8]|nr:MAG: hypothetical protein A2X49_03255 [Lentisphaerae bacterium GWF2_52_8]